MSEWQQVNVRVRESNYEEWKEYAESEYGGLSDLVRTAVRREIEGQHAGASGDESAAESETVTEVLEAIDRLENTVNGMDNRLSVVRETVESSGPDFSLRAAVRETLRAADGGLTTGQVAARLDARDSDVAEVLASMEGDEAYPTEDDPDTGQPRWNLFGGV